MRIRSFLTVIIVFGAAVTPMAQQSSPQDRKSEYVHAVTRGAGLLPWQSKDRSEAEQAFRAEIEARKDALLTHSGDIKHPVLYSARDLGRARVTAGSSDWAKQWVAGHVALADYVLAQPEAWIQNMIPRETPANTYGFTCPNCVGERSQEAVGSSFIGWSYKEPDIIFCTTCGQRYPDDAFPETAVLKFPRSGEEITYYLNKAERDKPDDRSGRLAWHWVGHPIHVSFTGVIRHSKVQFMRRAVESLALAHVFTGEPEYADAARRVLLRFATCYRNWLYHDYWDGYADCDPIYAAWHDQGLPLTWKRHLSENAFAKDSLEQAGMMQSYWGAGRIHPSTDDIGSLRSFALAYDLTCAARRKDASLVWSMSERTRVERDLLMEYIMGAEPYVGGANQAKSLNNKAPRVYTAMAVIAKCLGIPTMADTALRGYEGVRDGSFMYDGFCTESPAYNNMYLSSLVQIPEILHGFNWSEDFGGRDGVVDYYAEDPKLRLMYRGLLWSLQGNGQYLPLSDTRVGRGPSPSTAQIGRRRYPDLFAGTLPLLEADGMTEYAFFNLSEAELKVDRGLDLPETYFPAWQTAVLRHGGGADSATLTLALNPPGGHRHSDNLALFYADGGTSILGDHGYMGDMPVNRWIHSTLSHNLVVVNDGEQVHKGRAPELAFMASTPLTSVVEGSSNAYPQCTAYRRRAVLVKGPENHTFVVDLFRVAGGNRHAFRVHSEIAASDATDGTLRFLGLDMPPEPPMPQVGTSLAAGDIHGLRDVRSASPPADSWRAVWQDARRAYRMWMLSPIDRVEASNGPGQRRLDESGRRVRYVDAIREGEGIFSTFVAVHEPGFGNREFVITEVERLHVSAAGEQAVALRVESAYGTYYFLNDFEQLAEVDGLHFQGTFAVVRFSEGILEQYMTVEATALDWQEESLVRGGAKLACEVTENDAGVVTLSGGNETPAISDGAQAYLRAQVKGRWTGFPVDSVSSTKIRVKDYPLPKIEKIELPSVRYWSKP